MQSAQRLALLWAVTGVMGGCSLLLDSDCADNSECGGGVCKSGLCEPADAVDTTVPDGADMDVDVTDSEIAPDAADAEILPDVIAPDMMPDARGPTVAPTCEFETPRGDVIQDSLTLEVSVLVADADTPIESLSVTLGMNPIVLDAAGIFVGQTELDPGENTVTLVVTDPDGERCETSVEAIADLTAPVVTLHRPQLTNVAAHLVRGDVTEQYYDDDLMVTVDGEAVDGDPEFTGSDFVVTVPLGADGEKEVCVVATDRAGNDSEAACYTVRLDTAAPVLRIISPAANFVTTDSSVLVQGVVTTDGAAEARSQIQVIRPVNGGRAQANGEGEFDLNVQLFIGENTLEICGDDEAGNDGCATVDVTREDPLPCVEITPPNDGGPGSREVEVITGTVCPAVESVTLQLGDGPVINGAVADGEFEAQIAFPGPGNHTLVVVATARDETAQDSIELVYDATGPELRMNRPEAGSCVNDVNLRFSGSATDAGSGVTSVTVFDPRVPGELSDAPLMGVQWEVTLQPNEGANVPFEVVAVNGALLETRLIHNLNVDHTGPTIELDFAERAWLGLDGTGKVVLTGRLVTEICGARSLVAPTGPGPDELDRLSISPNGGFEYKLTLPDGEHQVTLIATDLATNETRRTPGFRVDSQPPAFGLFDPAAETYVNTDDVEFSAQLRDETDAGVAESGVARATIDGQNVAVTPVADDVDAVVGISGTVSISEGRTCFEITGEDNVGNSSNTTVCLRRDTTPPVVTVETPSVGAFVPSPAIVSGTFTDGEFGSGTTEVTVNGVDATLDHEAGTWRAVGVVLDSGVQTLSVTATDAQGNSADPAVTRDVEVRAFGHRAPGQDGLDATTDVSWIGSADFNGDNRPDLLAVSSAAGTSVYLQRPDGTFGERSPQLTGLRQDAAYIQGAVGDFNQNGRADVVLVGHGDNALFVGDGLGGFARQGQSNIPANSNIDGVAAGDLNRDGRLDLVLFAGAGSRVLIGAGDGTFEPEDLDNLGLANLVNYSRGIVADLNGDGVLDLLCASDAGSMLFIGARAGGFDVEPTFVGAAATNFAVLDANRDGILDVFSTGADARFHLTGAPFTNDDLGVGWGATSRLAVFGDFDGDSRDDAVTIATDGLSFWRGANGDFASEAPATLGLGGSGVTGLAVDIDNDGDLDILVGGSAGIEVLRNNVSAIAENYEWVKLAIRRVTADGGAGPADAVGVSIVQRDVNNGAYRALVANPFGSTLITAPSLVNDEFVTRFVDLGFVGQNEAVRSGLESGATLEVFGRE